MIKEVMLSIALIASCPTTKLIGFHSPLTKDETDSLIHAQKRCIVIFPEAPCLKSFEKREERVFWAICGKF